MMKQPFRFKSIPKLACYLLFLCTPSWVGAHSGHPGTHSFMDGLSHPFNGWDHLVAMLAVGLWSARLGGRSLWLLPSSFVAVMAIGANLGRSGIPLDSSELLILLSGLVLCILAAASVRFDIRINLLIVAFFAFFHGYAHGMESGGAPDFQNYALGFALATACLHGLGIVLGKISRSGFRSARNKLL